MVAKQFTLQKKIYANLTTIHVKLQCLETVSANQQRLERQYAELYHKIHAMTTASNKI